MSFLSATEKRAAFVAIVGSALYTFMLEAAGVVDHRAVIEAPQPGDELTYTIDFLFTEVNLTFPDFLSTIMTYAVWTISFPLEYVGVWIDVYESTNLWGFEFLLVIPGIVLAVVIFGIILRVAEVLIPL